jgi:hypothetical protein
MQRARAFFYVSLGVVALAVVFHLGAKSAQSQSAGQVGAVRFGATLSLVAASNGDVYLDHHASDGSGAAWTLVGHIPTTSPIVGIGNEDGNNVLAYGSNGDLFSSTNFGSTWQRRGNMFGAVSTMPTTWGRIKADRR